MTDSAAKSGEVDRTPPSRGSKRRRTPMGRAWDRFIADPTSGRKAIVAIIAVTGSIVVIAGLAFWLLDPEEYADFTSGLWLAIQTITTVGYGDVPPGEPWGRTVAGVTMLVGAATIGVFTALITSALVEARQALRSGVAQEDEQRQREHLDASLSELRAQLERIERRLGENGGEVSPPTVTR
jgi:voltage-gated potassium channel